MKFRHSLIFSLAFLITGCFPFDGENSSCYQIKNGEVFLRYYGGYPRAKEVLLKIKEADAESFHFIENSRRGDCQGGDIYAKDKYSVFYRTEKINLAKTETFEVLGLSYSKDDSNVFYKELVIENADPKSFYTVTNDRDLSFGADKHSFFYQKRRIEISIDGKSFVVFPKSYYKDKNHVYYSTDFKILEDAHAASFTCPEFESIVNYQYYAFDKYNAYYYEGNEIEIIPNIDFASFKVLGTDYAKDKNNVYYKSQIIAGADVESFSVPHRLNRNVGKDKNHTYVNGKIDDE